MSEISRIMLVAGANLTGMAKRLENYGFIIRKFDPTDERVKILEITPKGKRTLKNIEKKKDHWLEVMLVDLSRSERLDLLEKIRRIKRRCRKLE